MAGCVFQACVTEQKQAVASALYDRFKVGARMTDTAITQCPYCQTSLRFKRSTLNAAQGSLRCDACLQVFQPTLQRNSTESMATQTKTELSGIHATADELPLFPNRQHTYNLPSKRRSCSRWFLWLLAGSLVLLMLLGFYAYSNFAQLARQEYSRQWLAVVCPLFGCQLPAKVDVLQIKSSNLRVGNHPEFSGAVLIDAVIYNRAPFNQNFPLVKLTFADQHNQALTSRVFKPQEYLSGTQAQKKYMPSQVPIHISLELLNPSADAFNYHLSFISPD